MAGRSMAKLANVRDAIGAPNTLPLVVANAAHPRSLRAMAARTHAGRSRGRLTLISRRTVLLALKRHRCLQRDAMHPSASEM
jgi:hypothetical protein